MFDKLKQLENKYELICARMEEPSTYADPAVYSKFEREARELEPLITAYRAYQKAERTMADAMELMAAAV